MDLVFSGVSSPFFFLSRGMDLGDWLEKKDDLVEGWRGGEEKDGT